jgi:hypothetical protein
MYDERWIVQMPKEQTRKTVDEQFVGSVPPSVTPVGNQMQGGLIG